MESRIIRSSLIMISFFLFLVLCAASTASAKGGSSGSRLRSLPPQTKHGFDQSVDQSQQDYTHWETTHHVPKKSVKTVKSCSAKYNETITSLNNELLDLSYNVTSNPTAQKNLTSYAEDQVKAAESERIKCLDSSLPTNGQPLTVHFTLPLPCVIFVAFSIFALL